VKYLQPGENQTISEWLQQFSLERTIFKAECITATLCLVKFCVSWVWFHAENNICKDLNIMIQTCLSHKKYRNKPCLLIVQFTIVWTCLYLFAIHGAAQNCVHPAWVGIWYGFQSKENYQKIVESCQIDMLCVIDLRCSVWAVHQEVRWDDRLWSLCTTIMNISFFITSLFLAPKPSSAYPIINTHYNTYY